MEYPYWARTAGVLVLGVGLSAYVAQVLLEMSERDDARRRVPHISFTGYLRMLVGFADAWELGVRTACAEIEADPQLLMMMDEFLRVIWQSVPYIVAALVFFVLLLRIYLWR